MLSFFCSVLSSSSASKLLRRLVRWWFLSSVVNVPLVGLVRFVGRKIIRSNVKNNDPPVRRWYPTDA
jgi:hypothetical protein